MKIVDIPILEFKNQKGFHNWLEKNHRSSDGIWLKFYKKASGIPTVTYAEALDEALCYGWIDSQVKSLDEKAYLQKFTPRRTKSVWSKINTQKVEKLIKEGRMHEAGQLQIDLAKSDGRWQKAYDSPTDMKIPEDFLKEISKNPKAKNFFDSLNKSNRFAVAFMLHNAKKPETRIRRIKKFIDMFERGEKIY